MIKQLREKMDKLSVAMHNVMAACKAENRCPTNEENTQWDNMLTEYNALESNVKRATQTEQIGNDLRLVPKDQILDAFNLNAPDARARRNDADPHAVAFSAYLRGGIGALTPEQQQIMRNRVVGDIRNAQTSTTTGGGYTIPQGFSDQLEAAKKWFGGIESSGVGRFKTTTGNVLPWPTTNDTNNKGRIIGQNVQISETDVTFGSVSFGAYIGSSDSVLVPLSLLEDSAFDLDGLIAGMLGARLGRLFNYECTVGTGTLEPTGIVPAAITAGNVLTLITGNAAVIADVTSFTDLEHKVDPAYRDNPSSQYMFTDAMLQLLKKLKDDNKRPLWQAGLSASFQTGAGVVLSRPLINDHPYIINSDMAAPAADAYSALFGDLSKFKVRELTSGTTLIRLVERYMDYFQIGYIAFQRFDSNLIDAGTNPIAVMRQSHT